MVTVFSCVDARWRFPELDVCFFLFEEHLVSSYTSQGGKPPSLEIRESTNLLNSLQANVFQRQDGLSFQEVTS